MKKHSAFSLVELSIVVLIIGILIVGINQGLSIVKKAKIQAAETITTSSIVLATDDLFLWFETSSSKSFVSGQAQNSSSIDTWYSLNSQSRFSDKATATSSGSYKPIYTTNVINGLPAIKFDGVDDYISPTTTKTSGDFTTFIVAKTSSTIVIKTQATSGISGAASDQKYLVFPAYEDATNTFVGEGISFGTNAVQIYEHSGGYLPAIISYSGSSPAVPGTNPTILSWKCLNAAHSLYLNGSLAATNTSTKSYRYMPYRLGGGSYGYFEGYIGEFIVFNRALSDEERKSIESYLSKKWSIKVS